MSDYTDDSVIIGPDGVVKGRAAIETLFAGFLAGLLRPGTYELAADVIHVEGEVLYVIWHANCEPADVVFAADTFIIQNGKIKLQTFAPKLESHS